ncbi:XRE family transcriptional regulator [Stenotrophomonas sp. NPDC078853]|uniref:XRE family transcriptional regulator n=1 Tax=Stenotrophomonas sp. NPDC078853 TaxID=3364534 RepID=UPI00384EB5C8
MSMTFSQRMAAALAESQLTVRRLAELAKTSPGQVSQWQTEGKVQPENVKADVLERICAVLQVRPRWMLYGEDPMRGAGDYVSLVAENATPAGYVRLGLLGSGGMGAAVENQDFPEVVREMQFSEQHLRSIFGFLPKPGRIALITGRGHSMEPLISNGDVVMVDTSVTYYEDAGPYVINLGDGQQIKTLQNRGDGIYVISLNEKVGGPAFRAPPDMLIGGKVYVVQKFVMAH